MPRPDCKRCQSAVSVVTVAGSFDHKRSEAPFNMLALCQACAWEHTTNLLTTIHTLTLQLALERNGEQ